MDTNFKHWLFADPLIAEVEGWSIPGFGRPKPQQQPAAPTENTAGVQQEVERLAKELELWDRDPKTGQEDNWLEKSPMLRRAMTHLITVLHPQVGQGGMLMWNMLQSITDALIRKAKDRHPEGKVDPNVDETLQQAGTPTRLVKYLKGTWRAFNPKATIEGSMPGKSAEDNQAWWDSQETRYLNNQYGLDPNGDPIPSRAGKDHTSSTGQNDAGKSAGQSNNIVIRTIEVMPKKVLSQLRGPDLEDMAQRIATALGATPPSREDLTALMKRQGLIGG